jgi:hypothetical protein
MKNRIQKTRGRAVVEHCRRTPCLKAQFDLDGVALIGAYALAIRAEGIALLVVVSHHGLQIHQTGGSTGARQAGQQFIGLGPARLVELEAYGLGTVPEHQAEELAACGGVLIFHFLVLLFEAVDLAHDRF